MYYFVLQEKDAYAEELSTKIVARMNDVLRSRDESDLAALEEDVQFGRSVQNGLLELNQYLLRENRELERKLRESEEKRMASGFHQQALCAIGAAVALQICFTWW